MSLPKRGCTDLGVAVSCCKCETVLAKVWWRPVTMASLSVLQVRRTTDKDIFNDGTAVGVSLLERYYNILALLSSLVIIGRTDRRTDGRTHGQTYERDARTDGQTDGRTEGRTDA